MDMDCKPQLPLGNPMESKVHPLPLARENYQAKWKYQRFNHLEPSVGEQGYHSKS